MLLKAITAKNAWFLTTGILIMSLNFKNLFVTWFLILFLTLSDIAIITVKGMDYHWVIFDISKSDAVGLLKS